MHGMGGGGGGAIATDSINQSVISAESGISSAAGQTQSSINSRRRGANKKQADEKQ
jgi:hypothetical protein